MTVAKNILRTKVQMLEKKKQKRLMLLLNCAACGKNEPTFIKNKELQNFD